MADKSAQGAKERKETESRAEFFREKVGEGVDPHQLFAGLVGNIALGSELAPSLAGDMMAEIRALVDAYNEIDRERIRKLIEGVDDE